MGMTIIKNYGMPHNCYDCDLHNYHECDLTGESIEEDYCWNGDNREKHCPLREVEAIPKAQYEARLKKNNELINDLEELRTMINKFAESYETRLKADMVATLTDIQSEFKEGLRCKGCCNNCVNACEDIPAGWFLDFIDAKINSLKENADVL